MKIQTQNVSYATFTSVQKGNETEKSAAFEGSVDSMHSKRSGDEAKIRQEVMKLQAIDTDVRAHEAAHLGAGGGVVTGGANFSYTRGPDGKMYATGGEVPIDTSGGDTPEATIQKARKIIAAAMAPANPSPQDYKVASSAMMMESRAQTELFKQKQELLQGLQSYAQSSDENALQI